MAQKPERFHKKNVKHHQTDVFNTLTPFHNVVKSYRTLYRDQVENNSKRIKPSGIKTFTSMTRNNKQNCTVADVIVQTEPNVNSECNKKGKRAYEHEDTFKKVFSVERAKTVGDCNRKGRNEREKTFVDKFPLMKSDHLNDLFERQKMFNDEYKEDDIAIKPNNMRFNLLVKGGKGKKK